MSRHRKTLFNALVAVALLAPGLPVFAQGVELLPRAAIFGNPSKTQGLVSPDGKWLSWIAPRDGVLNVWVAPAADPTKAKPLTDEKVRPIRQHFWAQNSKMLLYINDSGGDENFLLYGVSPDGGAVKNFTPFKKTRVIQVGDSRVRRHEILLGPNHRHPPLHDMHLPDPDTRKPTPVHQTH